ncbi:MAG: TRAP transporter substrate-binding protein [Moraxellaceae bacterium]
MKKLVLALALAATCAAQAQTTSPVTWKLATGYRAETFHTQNLMQLAQDVKEATAGALQIEVVPNNQLVRLAEIPQAVMEGTKAQAGEAIMVGMTKDFPLAGADGVPFVVGSYAAAAKLWDLQRPQIEKDFAQRGLRVLYAVPWPPQGLYTRKPVSTVRDFAGLKMRTYNPTTVRIAELLGATPVDVPMVQVGQALAEGRMDAMITSAVTGVENKVWGGLTHYYELNAWLPKNIVFVNAKAFDALPVASRQALLRAASRAETRGFALSQQAAQSATDELRRNGMKVEPVPLELARDLRRMGERFSREWVQATGHGASTLFLRFYGLK